MLINFNHLQTFYDALKQKLKSHHGNWKQNDPNADDYIKNRPFYSEFGEIVILPETEISYGESFIECSPLTQFIEGQLYTVMLGKIKYECIAYSFNGFVVIGNSGIIGGKDTREPFFIGVSEEEGGIFIIFLGSGTYTISILTHGEIVHKIDKKYLPDILDIKHGGTGVNSIVDTIYEKPRYRASSLHPYETTPSNNGTICWTYE